MQQITEYINNNYYPKEVLKNDLPSIFTDENQSQLVFEQIIKLFEKHDYSKLNENQLEEELLKPILHLLSYDYITQAIVKVHGKQLKPDYILFPSDEIKSTYLKEKSLNKILSIFEAKAWGLPLDSKKIDDSPHMQLVQYNLFMGVPYGILSNGKEWRFYDLRERKSEKIFFAIDLDSIIKNHDYEAFCYFYYIFRKEYFVQTDKITPIDQITKAKERFIQNMENDLKETIYGKDSIIEQVGRTLARTYPKESLSVLFEHSVVMAYRLLFIAYFEMKFKSDLFDNHDHYKSVALLTLYDKLVEGKNNIKSYQELYNLFVVLNEGSIPFKIPLLNGGLFDPKKAPLFVEKPDLFTNDELYGILSNLLKPSASLGVRDFSMMSVTHIGNIYEGLLQYTFRVSDEVVYYMEYYERSDLKTGYFDTYDYESIAKGKNSAITIAEEIPSGVLYLVNRSNSRKISASYYTPQSLSKFMVKDAVKTLLEEKSDKILDVKIVDNACGSGHFLVDLLDELTEQIYGQISNHEYLKVEIEKEKIKIHNNIEQYSLENIIVDELQVLKRILLKKVIYGVDLQEFAVELTRLSLWLKTFIFGTPLSFIEHHIKQGNSLIGSSIKEGDAIFNYEKNNQLFVSKFHTLFNELGDITKQLVNLADNTTEEIKQSKEIYYNEIEPKQKKLSLILDLITYFKLQNACQKAKNVELLKLDFNKLFNRLEDEVYNGGDQDSINEICRVAKKYSFFHYDIAFPELEGRGFDIMIGNPPWDKVKFDEKDFFPQYRSNYRTMSVSEKKALRENLMNSPTYSYVQQDYHSTMTWTNTSLAYYKAHYPMNGGAGDSNLFRLFIEKNLSMLETGGRLIYVTPSAWSYEEGSLQIRKHIIDNLQFNYFYQFENRNKIFNDVDSRYKFAIWSVTNTTKFNETVPCFFMERDVSRLYPIEGQKMKQIHYPLEISRTHFPNSYIMLEINDEKALDIINQMYSVGHAIDPNYIDFRNELHMTNDNDLFIESAVFDNPQAEVKRSDCFPLYEGKMIHQFNPNFAKAQYWVHKKALKERLLPKEIYRIVDSIYNELIQLSKDPLNPTKQKFTKEQTVLNYLGLKDKNELAKFVKYDYEYPRLAFRAIARNTDERTQISSLILDNCTASNSVWASIPKEYILRDKGIVIHKLSKERTLWVNASFNSIPMDFVLRFLVDINVNKTYLMQLPLIHATDEQLQTEPYKTIWQNALALTASYEPKFAPLAESYSLKVPNSDKAKDMLQIENDILIAQLYGITSDQMLAILDTFPVLTKNKLEYVAALKEQAKKLKN
ncbi:MAG: Eco57I restriction-modification methylase domain-containing protein [Brevinema sp.]